MKKKLVSAIFIIAMVFAFFAVPVLASNKAQEPVCPFAEKIQAAFDTVFLPIVPAMESDGDGFDLLLNDLLAPVHEVIDSIVYTMDLLPDERIIMTAVHHFFEDITLEIYSLYEDFIVADLSFSVENFNAFSPLSLSFPCPLNRTVNIIRTKYYLHARIGSVVISARYFIRDDRAVFINPTANFSYVSYLPQILITAHRSASSVQNNGRIPGSPSVPVPVTMIVNYYLTIRNFQGEVVTQRVDFWFSGANWFSFTRPIQPSFI